MPAGHGTPAMNPIDGEADLTVTGTFIVIYPPRHAWGKWHHLTLTLGLPWTRPGSATSSPPASSRSSGGAWWTGTRPSSSA